ncbi:MAG: glycosyl hydrolase, partial [Burkholderiales bacterium PBB5]
NRLNDHRGNGFRAVQRSDLQHDRPLFAVHFVDAQRGVAVGLWSLVLTTADGGAHWSPVPLATPPGAKKADLNLLGLFADAQGRLYATGERGMLLRSADQGARWDYLGTGYAGSFWTGAAPAPGVLLAAGLRGSLYRSADDGKTWARVDSGSTSAITALLHRGAAVVALGLDGLVLRSADGGATFSATPRADRLALTTGVLTADGEPVLFSRQGTVARTAKP